ncbi:IclR family transcriptional regulator [Microbacterium kribbense]|uniref:IclR family transcriptional regulator n=1 Tax=Microbacterium kribbense TaxID=433645 RepID=A0ABP7GKY4_9MICO
MTTQSVGRALELLQHLAAGPRSLDECAQRLGVHKTTVLRLLQTLAEQGFVSHDERHRYRLGRTVFALASAALEQWDVRGIARPHLERLGAATGQTVHLAAHEAGQVVYIDKIEARSGIRMYSRIGLTAPVHATAVGKVLLAAMPGPAREQAARGILYTRFTDRTITTAADYLAELNRVRAEGFAHDWREHESFVNCVAAPIRDGSGAVVAAVSVSVPTVSLDADEVLALVPTLRGAAAAASADLGWPAPAAADTTEGVS